jgi:hypothetical protein
VLGGRDDGGRDPPLYGVRPAVGDGGVDDHDDERDHDHEDELVHELDDVDVCRQRRASTSAWSIFVVVDAFVVAFVDVVAVALVVVVRSRFRSKLVVIKDFSPI